MTILSRWPFITALAFLLFSIWPLSSQAETFPSRYDAAIERAVKTWWGDFRYPEWWKAQLWQESRLDPSAVSPAGARGIAQFMPATWRDVVARLDLPRGADPHEARFAIDAGAYYMASLRRAWYAKRSALDRQRLAQASYNAGLGNIVKAQRLCGGVAKWCQIAPCLPHVTGIHARETRDYVRLIAHWHERLVLGDAR